MLELEWKKANGFVFIRVSFNSGAPWNVTAGSQPDLSHVVAHYEREHQKMEEARVNRMKDGKTSIYD